jgi:hypothetical protein
MSSYINDCFNELSDLHSIDDRISDVNTSLLALKSLADSKVNSMSDSRPLPPNPLLQQAATDAVASLHGAKSDPQILSQVTTEISGKYGAVGTLSALQQALAQRAQVNDNIAYLTQAIALKSQLRNETSDDIDSSISSLVSVSSKLVTFAMETNPLSHEIMVTLKGELDGKISKYRKVVESSLNDVLTANKWLSGKQTNVSNELMKQIRNYATQLVDLQLINNVPKYPNTWWVLDILLNPIIARFDYHFNQKRETNQISKPEWALEFVESFLADNLTILNMVVGDIIRENDRIVEFEIITTLLQPVREKLFKIAAVLNKNIESYAEDAINLEKSGRLLSHLIFEVSGFDQRLRNTYKYNPYVTSFDEVPECEWEGLTGDVLTHDELNLENWLMFERKLSHKRFHTEILQAKDAYEIDYDYNSKDNRQSTKPTYSAYNLTKLFNNLTSHFYTLTTLSFQIKYVKTIQLELIDLYYDDLMRSFKEFNTKFQLKSVLSFLPGGTKETADLDANSVTNGLKALDHLTGIYCSAIYISEALEQWCNELSFIQINNHEHKNIFNDAIGKYDDLIQTIVKKYGDFFAKEIKFCLKKYVNSINWDTDKTSEEDLASPELALLVNTVPVYLNHLERSMSHLQYVLITDKVVTIISNVFYEYVVNNNQFTANGVSQLKRDIEFVTNQLSSVLNLHSDDDLSNKSNGSFIKLCQSVELLGKFPKDEAVLFNKGTKPMTQLRSSFDDKLDHLTNHDILSLLPRLL